MDNRLEGQRILRGAEDPHQTIDYELYDWLHALGLAKHYPAFRKCEWKKTDLKHLEPEDLADAEQGGIAHEDERILVLAAAASVSWKI